MKRAPSPFAAVAFMALASIFWGSAMLIVFLNGDDGWATWMGAMAALVLILFAIDEAS